LKPQVTVDAHSCLRARAQDIYHVVAVELDAQLVSASDATPGTTRVSIRCERNVAEIVVLDPTTGKTVVRSIDLSEAPVLGRARLLALATVELVSASWAELELAGGRRTRSLGERASDRERAAARSSAGRRDARTPSVRAVLGPQLLLPLSDAPLLAGGLLRVARASAGPAWSGSLMVARGGLDDSLGEVSVVTASAGMGLGWRVSWRSWAASVGLEARLGSSWWSGSAREPSKVDGHDFAASFAAAGISGGAEYALSSRVGLQLLLTAEQVIKPVYVRSAGVRAHGLEGRFIGAALASSFAF
jgi:hypothetical protein